MQVLITHGSLARARVVQFTRAQLIAIASAIGAVLVMLSGAIYHVVFLAAVRDGWPVVSEVVHWVMRDEVEQRERIMRENLDAMAQRLGEVQAKVMKLEAMGERVSGLAGVKATDLAPLRKPDGAKGGPYVPLAQPSAQQLEQAIDGVDSAVDLGTDLFTLAESRLLEKRLDALMLPSSAPVDGPIGSRFGLRADPFTGLTALHTGLDYPAEVGVKIHAAAGGVVASTEVHPEYGNLLVIDHGNGVTSRYAHTSRFLVKGGDLVRRGQAIAEIGASGRSTGPHLHFEVLVDGVPQNPARFLARAQATGSR